MYEISLSFSKLALCKWFDEKREWFSFAFRGILFGFEDFRVAIFLQFFSRWLFICKLRYSVWRGLGGDEKGRGCPCWAFSSLLHLVSAFSPANSLNYQYSNHLYFFSRTDLELQHDQTSSVVVFFFNWNLLPEFL